LGCFRNGFGEGNGPLGSSGLDGILGRFVGFLEWIYGVWVWFGDGWGGWEVFGRGGEGGGWVLRFFRRSLRIETSIEKLSGFGKVWGLFRIEFKELLNFDDDLVFETGVCRQVLAENCRFEKSIKILCADATGRGA
jgi:hypothetical protein